MDNAISAPHVEQFQVDVQSIASSLSRHSEGSLNNTLEVNPTVPFVEGGDALRPLEAHPRPEPATPARSQWCQRRIPPRRHRPEPPKTREAAASVRQLGGHGMI